ncbi:hypothetical protein [Winogradskyella sp. UBA3174]|uniref:hypothetical protein n=1 Tax=Winogradskyella sp. UBA3174 TaxID=1947785 RepID=UPI0025F5C02B|nr:hypothetical protein [Winogradskyella sp. UBA3174]|tara:strand:- start:32266 stop:32640 length:375 start_codon:yes stop_codon:yes gene_type:complete
MKESLQFDFCDMTIYDNYLVVVIKEGVNITPNHNNVLLEVADKYFSEKPFVYITHRINSYSVDPKIYYETSQIETLKGFAVVSSNYKAKINAQIEKMFFNKPFEIFTDLDNAISWADTILKIDS